MGLRKRIEIVKRAIEKGVRVMNVTKDVIEELKKRLSNYDFNFSLNQSMIVLNLVIL